MVDPNRKINRLTDKDIDFLDDCEKTFANRYTTKDEEYVTHCNNPVPNPPIFENWSGGGGGGTGGGAGGDVSGNSSGTHNIHNRGDNQRRGGGNYRNYNRGWQRGAYGGRHKDNYERKFHPYRQTDHHHRRRDHETSESRSDSRRSESVGGPESSRPAAPPMTFRRDYGNFVPASKDQQ